MAFLISIIPSQQHEICENFNEFLPAAEKLWYQSITGKSSMSPIMMELWSCDRNDGNSSCHLSFIFGLNMPAQRDGWQQWEGWWWRVDGEIGWWQRAERAEPQPDPPWPVRGPTLIQQLSVGPPGQTRAPTDIQRRWRSIAGLAFLSCHHHLWWTLPCPGDVAPKNPPQALSASQQRERQQSNLDALEKAKAPIMAGPVPLKAAPVPKVAGKRFVVEEKAPPPPPIAWPCSGEEECSTGSQRFAWLGRSDLIHF